MPKTGVKQPMTVSEAGRLGGRKTAERGHDFYVAIGKKGGGRLREIVEAGKRAMEAGKRGKARKA